ncbi:ADP-ribosylhydrolase ARH1-like [Dreissena polymorpha]|uniref:ADP-ribosylhydrolase ARH1 n=1 Tax=Dreissena polymorpha TaxID=45954 RepID=A0A9D4LTG4_DREPO|nr:ADP-ribosylhydrolase ARH1-like [Dreissena polymorpha]KAH3863487.1 hypothetical protein DPMN_026476 [Dreissena polymorpha]
MTLGDIKRMREKYEAAMVLSGVGDALGFKNGEWEYCTSGDQIHSEVHSRGGLENIDVRLPDWRVSDDTIFHIATGKALAEHGKIREKMPLFRKLAEEYKLRASALSKRSPGEVTLQSCRQLDPWTFNGHMIPFNPKGGGSGAAMRSMCIGLRFWKKEQIQDLVHVSVEAGMMTHHHPTGYLGSLASALFTSYAIQGRPTREWGVELLKNLPIAEEYVKSRKEFVRENMSAWPFFENSWKAYLKTRGIQDGRREPRFPENFNVAARDTFYRTLSYDGWGGSSGHDAPMIAYDALLGSCGSWRELCNRAMFHGGDSDTTGVIAGCWYGALYGYAGVPERNFKNLEFGTQLREIGKRLYDISH